MSQHTPGPWVIDPNDNLIVMAEDVRVVADCAHALAMGAMEAESNARLIAAAPELLEALKAVEDWDDNEQDGLPRRLTASVKAAIAKATGGEK
jgi:hypothetical protein